MKLSSFFRVSGSRLVWNIITLYSSKGTWTSGRRVWKESDGCRSWWCSGLEVRLPGLTWPDRRIYGSSLGLLASQFPHLQKRGKWNSSELGSACSVWTHSTDSLMYLSGHSRSFLFWSPSPFYRRDVEQGTAPVHSMVNSGNQARRCESQTWACVCCFLNSCNRETEWTNHVMCLGWCVLLAQPSRECMLSLDSSVWNILQNYGQHDFPVSALVWQAQARLSWILGSRNSGT